jgi:NTP pyrophosphatase (non-canonical NTP hydrolase)|tara:strand:- start:926 stop:1189 length:264 start_codon:yes stop_codon:yes gene_type:complete
VNNIYVKTMEECGELIQACAKVLKHGDVEKENLSEECGDVMAQIMLLVESGIVNEAVMSQKFIDSKRKYRDLYKVSSGYKRGQGFTF